MVDVLLSARITPRTVDNSVHLLHLQWLDRWRCTSSRHIIHRGRIVTNNLTLNRNKSKKIVFSDHRRRRPIESPPPATDIAGVTSLKIILGVKMPVGVWPCPWRHQIMHADPIRAAGRARARHVSHGAAGHLPVSRHRQCSMHPVHGLGSPKRLTGSDSTVDGFLIPMSRQRHPPWLLLAIRSYICETVCQCRWTIIIS